MNAIATAARIVIPPDVRDFARERDVLPYLPVLTEITERIFADAVDLSVVLHDDPDVAGLRWLTFCAEVPWTTAAEVRQARDEWYARTAEACPNAVLSYVGLDIDRGLGS